jgi:hypothetical protein
MKTTRKDPGTVGQGQRLLGKTPLKGGVAAQATGGELKEDPKPELPAPVDPRAALKALALEHRMEAKKKKNRGAAALGLGARLMELVRGESGKKAFAALGLGMSLLGVVQPANAQTVQVEPATVGTGQVQGGALHQGSGDAVLDQMLLAMNGGEALPASSWLAPSDSATTAPKPLSPQAALIEQKLAAAQAQNEKPDLKLTAAHAQWQNSAELMFTVPSDMRAVKDGQSVLIPLEGGRELHMIELRYQDTRALQDFEFNMRPKGSSEWQTFRGDQYREMEQREKAGEVEIKREPDHNAMWINNPIRVRVDVVDANGQVLHSIGKKFLDPQLHDAWSPTGPGSAETDNISNGYEKLPSGKLPAGASLRLTPVHQDRKPWEAERTVAMDLSWVKPIYMPEHSERVSVRQGSWEKPQTQGYAVEAGRPMAAVLVTWTDHGGTSSGSVRLTRPDGSALQTPSYNVGSGETELIPLDGAVSHDGKLFIEGYGLEVGNIQVLYR